MKKRIKVAISGLGNIGIKHFKSIIKNKKIQLTNIFDVDSKKNKIFRKNRIINNFNNIFKNKLNAIIISSPDENHCDQIKKSLKKGVNVFCEKPLCNSSSELNSIYKTWKNNKNLRIKTNLLLRKVEIYIWLKKKIEQNYFGKIYSIDAEYLYGRRNKIINGWRRYSKNYSGIRGGGVHMIDLILWLTEELPKSVMTFGNKISLKKYKLKFDDYNKSILQFKSGLIAQINSNLGCVHKHHHTIKIFGAKKTFIYDDKGPRIYATSNDKFPKRIFKNTLPVRKTLVLEDFFKHYYKFKKKYFDSTEYELNLVSILNACVKSSTLKKKIEIKYICKKKL